MMKKMTRVLIAGMLLLCVAIGAYAHNAGGGKAPVNLTVNSAKDGLETTRSSECTGNPSRPTFVEPGCLRFAKGFSDQVSFNLTGNPICRPGGGGNPPVQWELDGVQLANVNGAKPDPWPDMVTDLDARAVRDFNANPATGWINSVGGAGPQITVTNRNVSESGYAVWYRVRASCPGTEVAPIYLDPRMDNEGNP